MTARCVHWRRSASRTHGRARGGAQVRAPPLCDGNAAAPRLGGTRGSCCCAAALLIPVIGRKLMLQLLVEDSDVHLDSTTNLLTQSSSKPKKEIVYFKIHVPGIHLVMTANFLTFRN